MLSLGFDKEVYFFIRLYFLLVHFFIHVIIHIFLFDCLASQGPVARLVFIFVEFLQFGTVGVLRSFESLEFLEGAFLLEVRVWIFIV